MDREELQSWLRQQPFQPFRLCLSDGRSYEVRDPRINLLARSFIKVGIPGSGPAPICDHTEFVRLAQIAGLEPLPPATNSSPS
jgi:hypothetical protein